VLDRDPEAVIDQSWFEAHIARALALRSLIYNEPFYRLIHAEADGLPGVVIDRFGDTAVIQPNAAWADALLEPLVAALVAVTGVTCVLKNAGGRTRSLEGLDDANATLVGQTPTAPVPVPALALAEQGAAEMGKADAFGTRQGDAFDVLTALRAEGQTFDLVICDPPAFAPARPALEAGLRAYERIARLAAPLVAENGVLGLCSCSHAADLQAFRTASVRGIGRAGRRAVMLHTGFAGPDHPQLPQLAETGYLKSLFFRV